MEDKRGRVDRWLWVASRALPRRVTRADLWKVAGYTDATVFKRWQRGEYVSSGAAARFDRVLRMSPDEFFEKLGKRTAHDRKNPGLPHLLSVECFIPDAASTENSTMEAKAAPAVEINLNIIVGGRAPRPPKGKQRIELQHAAQLLRAVLGDFGGLPEKRG